MSINMSWSWAPNHLQIPQYNINSSGGYVPASHNVPLCSQLDYQRQNYNSRPNFNVPARWQSQYNPHGGINPFSHRQPIRNAYDQSQIGRSDNNYCRPESNYNQRWPAVNPTLSLYHRERERQGTDFQSGQTYYPQTGQNRDLGRPVIIQKDPFYNIEDTLLEVKLTKKGTEHLQLSFHFDLTPDQVENLLSDESYQIQLRFCKLDTMREQPDYFPSSLQVAVNMNVLHLPGVHSVPKGPAAPVDITKVCHLRDNKSTDIHVKTLEECKMYVFLVKKLDSQVLIEDLEAKPQIEPDITSQRIKEKMSQDTSIEEIAPTILQCSLLCPISRTRLKLPCRALTCKHLQCFDAGTYIQMNEKKPKWCCPVCYESAPYGNLQIDGYFVKILNDSTANDAIELLQDGSWKPMDLHDLEQVLECHESSNVNKQTSVADAEKTINLASDDEDDDCAGECPGEGYDEPLSATVETITLSDDETSDAEILQITSTSHMVCSTPVSAHSRKSRKDLEDGTEIISEVRQTRSMGKDMSISSPTVNNNSINNPLEDAPDGSYLSLTVSSMGNSSPSPTNIQATLTTSDRDGI